MARPLTEVHPTLGVLLRRPYEHLSDWLYAELGRQGFPDIRPAFSAVLRHLPADGARVTDLAARAGMTKQSIGYLVLQMQHTGLVSLIADPDDRRANTVLLTERGRRAVETAMALSERYEAFLAERIGRRKIGQLSAVLEELHARLDESAGPPSD